MILANCGNHCKLFEQLIGFKKNEAGRMKEVLYVELQFGQQPSSPIPIPDQHIVCCAWRTRHYPINYTGFLQPGAGSQKKWAVFLPPILRGILIHRRRITEQTLELFRGLVLLCESKVSPNLDPLALQLMVLCVGLASL